MTFHTAIRISDASQIGEARRTAMRLSQTLGLNETQAGAAAIVATELATNLSRYGREGQVLVGATPDHRLEVIAVDKGPGMDVQRCMQDGFSSGGTAGNGLGAVLRLSDEFDVYSTEQGTAILSRLASSERSRPSTQPRIECGAVSLPAPGESVCGDSWYIDQDENQLRVLVVDGLGHGPDAADAANAATDLFRTSNALGPKDFIHQAHGALAGTRGAAVAAASLSLAKNEMQYAGVGNIGGSLLSAAGSRGLMSHNGTLGARMRTIQELEYEWPRGGLLVMFSDGIQNRWDLSKYPGLQAHHPSLIAGVLLQNYTRGRDDVTVVIIRRL